MPTEQGDSQPIRLVMRITIAGEKAVAMGEPAPVLFFEAETGEPFSGRVVLGGDGATHWGYRT